MDTLSFLELSLPVKDVRDSLAWYLALGFSQREPSDIRNYHYAVVSAGDFHIGLHAQHVTAPALSFVRPEVARYVRQRELEGCEFEYTLLGEDQFHEAGMVDPDGSLAIMMEARSFSAGSADSDSLPLTGQVDRLALPCMRLGDSLAFWQQWGFMAVESDIAGLAELHSADLTVELCEGTRTVSLIFTPQDLQQSLQAIEASNTPVQTTPSGHELIAPEGTRLLLQS